MEKTVFFSLMAAMIVASFMVGYNVAMITVLDTIKTGGEKYIEKQKDIKRDTTRDVPEPTINPTPTQPPPSRIMASIDDDPIKGDPNAPITIIEFSDYECPFCERFYRDTLPAIEDIYIDTGKVNFVYRDFPLDFHPNAFPAHVAAECAGEQGQYFPYHDILFDNQTQWASATQSGTFPLLVAPTNMTPTLEELLLQYAVDISLDTTSFRNCITSGDMDAEVRADMQEGSSYGASGTPTFYIGNDDMGYVELVGAQPFAAFKGIIDGFN